MSPGGPTRPGVTSNIRDAFSAMKRKKTKGFFGKGFFGKGFVVVVVVGFVVFVFFVVFFFFFFVVVGCV